MAADNLPCAEASGAVGSIRVWSEDRYTARIRATWATGDLLQIATSFATGAEEFADRLKPRPGDSLLDVGCGAGHVALAAAARGARAVGIDLVPYLIAQARELARSAGADATFEVADAESLPFPSRRFDIAVSMFGVIYAARPERAALELVRVVRPGGQIVLACWVEDGLGGRLLRALEAAVPPPTDLPSPVEWGHEETIRTRLGRGVASVEAIRRTLMLQFPFGPSAVTELFTAHHGPTATTIAAVDPAEASELRSALTLLFHQHNRATDGTTLLAADYLEVRATVAGPLPTQGEDR